MKLVIGRTKKPRFLLEKLVYTRKKSYLLFEVESRLAPELLISSVAVPIVSSLEVATLTPLIIVWIKNVSASSHSKYTSS